MSLQAGGKEGLMQQLLSLFNSRALCPRVRNLGAPYETLPLRLGALHRLLFWLPRPVSGSWCTLYLEQTVGEEGTLIYRSLHLPPFSICQQAYKQGRLRNVYLAPHMHRAIML